MPLPHTTSRYATPNAIRADPTLKEAYVPRSVEDDFDIDKAALNRGKFGVVRAATLRAPTLDDVALQRRRVAVKTVARRRSGSDCGISEVDIVNSIDSPRTMRFEAAYLTRRKWHLVSPLYDGGDLFDLIVGQEDACFDERNASALFRQVLLAIEDCHAAGVVHLDIKPENFCLAKRLDREAGPGAADAAAGAELVLIDFGYAMRLRRETALVDPFDAGTSGGAEEPYMEWRLKNVAGSVTYAAPELLKSRYSKASDLWSAGVVLHILLAGQPPWQQDHQYTVAEKAELIDRLCGDQSGAHAPLWRNVSPEAKDLVRRLLVVDPKQRLTAAEALRHPFVAGGAPLVRTLASEVVHEADMELPLAA